MAPRQQYVDTPGGQARVHTYEAATPRGVLLLGHGAGAGVDTVDLTALADQLPAAGVTVQLLEQPWRVAGRKLAGPPASLDAALLAVVEELRGDGDPPLVVGGRSAGARSAARCATRAGAVGVLALAFPLHPPGKPERSRLDELRGTGVPTLVVQGERDAFGRPEEFPTDVDLDIDLAVVPSADHGFAVPARGEVTEDEAMAVIVESVLEWVVREIGGVSARTGE